MAQAHLPPAKGDVQIRGMTFRYEAGGREVLKNINLAIPAGQVIGIVGPSGSGKSTLTKLVQRLYTPERGQILVDGIDVGQVDPAWLRRQVGVVLQENLLFNKTVHENIALVNPAMSRAQVIAMARLSGADEFINRLPLGYDTMIVERGANLSGGQRQRLAIARALAANPRILILDEATSALDYESERIIQDNMRHIVHGRTVIIIAHRLAAVRDCDRIIAVQDGNIVEDGSHNELLALPTSLYGRLWRIQAGESGSRMSTHQPASRRTAVAPARLSSRGCPRLVEAPTAPKPNSAYTEFLPGPPRDPGDAGLAQDVLHAVDDLRDDDGRASRGVRWPRSTSTRKRKGASSRAAAPR